MSSILLKLAPIAFIGVVAGTHWGVSEGFAIAFAVYVLMPFDTRIIGTRSM